jgi:outer membrane receptor protein involved in Fe transport
VAWENSYFRYANLGQQVLFSDLSATYNFGRFELGLSARNIGNKHAYEQKLVATDYQVINQYKLRPREYMLRLSFSY